MEIFKNKCSEYFKENIELNEKLQKLNSKIMEVQQSKRKKTMKDLYFNNEVP